MIPAISIEMPSKAKIPITAQTTPSRPNNPPTIACRAINPCPLEDQIPLELRHRPEDLEDQLAPGRSRVDALAQAHELYAPLFEVAHQLDQFLQGPAEAVELPYHQGVAFPHVLQRRPQLGPRARGS